MENAHEDTIRFPKGTLKKRGKGYVVYNPEWLKENWQTELKVMGIEFEDAISREAVLEQTYSWSKDEFLRVTNPFDYLRKRINSLPPVTPKQKMGRWIRITNGAMKEKYICSVCGRQIEDDGIEGLLPIKYPFCHCGAKMGESEDEE